jgi:hypothetical protein
MKRSAGKISAKITADEIKQAFREHLHSVLGRLDSPFVRLRCGANSEVGNKKVWDQRSYLALAENAIAERVKQAASDLRASGKATFAS